MYFLDLTSFQEARRNRLELANHSISKLMNLYELIDIQNMLRKNHIFNDVTNYLKGQKKTIRLDKAEMAALYQAAYSSGYKGEIWPIMVLFLVKTVLKL
jgi:hypothetical protein